jgi:hypothetical protein
MQTRKPGNDVDHIVAKIDETRISELWRNPDRPNARFVKQVRRQDPKITAPRPGLGRPITGIDSISAARRRRIRSAWRW